MGIIANKLAEEARDRKAQAYDNMVQNQKYENIARAGADAGAKYMAGQFQAQLDRANAWKNRLLMDQQRQGDIAINEDIPYGAGNMGRDMDKGLADYAINRFSRPASEINDGGLANTFLNNTMNYLSHNTDANQNDPNYQYMHR